MTFEKDNFAEYLTEIDKEKYKNESERLSATLDERYMPLEVPTDVEQDLEDFRTKISEKLELYGLPNRLNNVDIKYVSYRYTKLSDKDQFSLNGESIGNNVVVSVSTKDTNLMSEPDNLALLKEVTADEIAHYVRQDVVGKRYLQAQTDESADPEVWEQVTTTNLGFENLTRRTDIKKENTMQTTGGLWNEPMAIFFSLDCLDDQEYQATTQYDEHVPFIATLINEYARRNQVTGTDAFRELFGLYAKHNTEFFSRLVDTFGNREIKELNNVKRDRSPIDGANDTKQLEDLAEAMGFKQAYLDNIEKFNTSGIGINGIHGTVKRK